MCWTPSRAPCPTGKRGSAELKLDREAIQWQTVLRMSRQVVLDLPEGAFSALRSDPAELAKELRLAAAAKWYELGRLSQEKAAELAGLSRYDFIHALARFEVSPIQETLEEITKGLAREQ